VLGRPRGYSLHPPGQLVQFWFLFAHFLGDFGGVCNQPPTRPVPSPTRSSFCRKDERVYVGHEAIHEANKRSSQREVRGAVSVSRRKKLSVASYWMDSCCCLLAAGCSAHSHFEPHLIPFPWRFLSHNTRRFSPRQLFFFFYLYILST